MSLEAGAAPRMLVSPAVVTSLLDRAGIHPSRSLGQNFLVDANILRIIAEAAELSALDTVIEVGAGLGALTQALVERSGRVYALESDRRLIPILEQELSYARNLVLVEADAARFDFTTLWEVEPPDDVKMVSNLPYQIAATLLVNCLKRCPWLRLYTIMVQREVADRLVCGPGSRDYSAASVKVQVRTSVRRVANVSRNSFYPRPGVDSTILHLERRGEHEPGGTLEATDAEHFDRVVTAAFSQRRKKLVNALCSAPGLGVDSGRAREAVEKLGRDSGSRAEDLSPAEYLELSSLLKA
jgi:16S rRNA (adenine1518-N6/adenine1519-N6)-dimethyltransferase